MKKGISDFRESFNSFFERFKKESVYDRQLKRLSEALQKDFDPKIFALNAFFSALIDYEHSGKDFKLKNLHESVDAAVLYFGSTNSDGIQNLGSQVKHIYPLTAFITQNDLWANIKKKKRFSLKRKYIADKGFNQVVAALNANPDQEVSKVFSTYPFAFFEIAYTAVAEIGHAELMNDQPWYAGQKAIKIIMKAKGVSPREKSFYKRFLKYIFKVVMKTIKFAFKAIFISMLLFSFYWLLSNGYAMFLFD